jgi:D-alanyl-D-alanine carboxypeptidase/D-alanyl-D-alanine-endopeptidase (penicillin-binding protein 4)
VCECDAKDGHISNTTALMTDGARVDPSNTRQQVARHWVPDIAAANQFAAALGLPESAVVRGQAQPQARALGQVLSPSIGRLVEIMLSESDNVVAEGLARQVALAKGRPGSFAGASEATTAVLAEIGIDLAGNGLVDGSGLSNNNKVSPAQLTSVLAHAASPKYPALRAIVSGLPVAAYSGTLAERFQNTNSGAAAAGTVRAKTGTLTGISSLAGVVVDADGRLLAFALLADARLGQSQAQAALDRVAATIAGCGCR